MRHLAGRSTAVLILGALLGSCGGGEAGSTGPTPNPVPTLTSLSRDTATATVAPFALVVRGTGFISGSVGSVDSSPRTTVRLSDTTLSVQLQSFELGVVGDHEVRVSNPSPGGGTSAAATLHVLTPPPAPILDSITPDTAQIGGTSRILNVYGSAFTPQSKITWNGGDLTTTALSATHLLATLTTGMFGVVDTIPVAVRTPGPGGGTSSSKVFRILPPPAITRIFPDTMRTGGAPGTLHILGHGFTPGTVIDVNPTNATSKPPVTFIADTELTVQIPLNLLGTKDMATVSLDGVSTYKVLTFLPPHALVTSITPDSAALDDSIAFTVRGSGFLPGGDPITTIVRWRGTTVLPSQVTDTSLVVNVGSNGARAGGIAEVSIQNYTDDTVVTIPFTITRPVPVITKISHALDTVGTGPRWITGNAMGVDTTTRVLVDGVPHNSGASPGFAPHDTGVFSVQLTALETADTGAHEIRLVNQGPGGGTSTPDTVRLIRPNPTPLLDSISPAILAKDTTNTGLVVHGHSFVPGASIRLGPIGIDHPWSPSLLPTTFVDSTELQFALPDSFAAYAALFTITVFNPAPVADHSQTDTLTIRSSAISDLRHLDQAVDHLVGDTIRHRLYASSLSYSGDADLLVIDPSTGNTLTSIPLGGSASDLKMSADGAWLYAAIPSTKSILRFDLSTLMVDRNWHGPDWSPGLALGPVKIAPSLSEPGVIAILTEDDPSSGGQQRVAVYDDTVIRPNLSNLSGGGASLDFINDSTLAAISGGFPASWHLFGVDSSGVHSAGAVMSTSAFGVLVTVRGDTILTSDGHASLLSNGALLGTLTGQSFAVGEGDTLYSTRRLGNPPAIHEFRAFTLGDLSQLGTIISTTGVEAEEAATFVRWSHGGFAAGGAQGIDIILVDRGGW